jgi:hypothetical protein
MKRGVSVHVLFVGVTLLLVTGVAWSDSTKTSTSRTATSKTTTARTKTTKAATAQPKTVLDYFMLLPGMYFDGGDPYATRAVRKQWLREEGSIIDVKNDYLKMTGEAAQPTIYMALFRHKGRVLVGVYADGEGGGDLSLMRYEKGRWKDVTKAMLPVLYNHNYIYMIPRHGTTIRVTTGNSHDDYAEYGRGKKVYDLVWTQGKFKVQRG